MIAIYTRQSVERADSISVEQQADFCRAALTTAELSRVRVYTDKGFSGKNTDRPALQQLVADAKAGRVEKILVYRLDRISRSVHDFTGLCQELTEQGVHFQSVTEGIMLDDSLSGTVMAQIMMVFAQFERETIQRRVTDNYFARAKTGMYLGGLPPYGFEKGKTMVDGRHTACYVPHPAQSVIVRRMFERYVQDGETLGTLTRWLNAAGYRTARDGSWSTLPLGRLLRNPAFVRADAKVYRYLQSKGATLNHPIERFDQCHGCYCYAPLSSRKTRPTQSKFSDMSHSFITCAPHEGLIDAALWLQAQYKLDRNKALKSSGSGTHSWLSGLMKCQKCGYAITVVNKPNGMSGHYINCGGHKRGNAVCPGRTQVMTLEQIESSAELRLLEYLDGYRSVPMQVQQTQSAEGNRIEIELVRCEEDIKRLTQNLAHITEVDVIHIISAQIHERNQALTALRAERDALLYERAPCDLEPYFEAILTEWHDYTIPEKKKIACAVIEQVIVGDGDIEVVFRAVRGDICPV